MSAPRLRAVLASLYGEHRNAAPVLTRDAERAIGRHVAMRWWGIGGATVAFAGVMAALGAMVGISATSGENTAAEPTQVAEPHAIPAVAHIPLDGGPQYANQWGELECGDPAPASLPEAPPQRLSIALYRVGVGDLVTASVTWAAPEVEHVGRREPVVGMGAMEVVAVRDGIVVGMIITQDASLGWPQHRYATSVTGQATLGQDQFYCIFLDERTNSYQYHDVVLEPGTYEVLATTRVFATPESVALFQALAETHFTNVDERIRQGSARYEPGSPDCVERHTQQVTVRACLPDVIPTASLNEDAGTVTMLYDASALPQEFDVTLVSEPLTMVID